ncbi:MAG: TlyA family RNA methyltransferase [Oscillospiraceae bacterium]|nr:TlyA family RNA methyltransferase [Oscillospiraceae bacterium]
MSRRLDAELVARGLCETRNRAQTLIAEGHVTRNGAVCMKASQQVADTDTLRVTEPLPFVGRGGYKLSYALAEFRIILTGLHCLDIGASTGGFTDCMLQNGAASVLAVDVGHDQLAAALRNDPRVTAMEGTDLRELPPDSAGLPADFAACDVSFISLKQIIPLLPPLLTAQGTAVLLVKPQFEAGRAALNKHGVVRDEKVRQRVLREIRDCAAQNGLLPEADCESPVKGGSGNTEYLLFLRKIANNA